MSHTPTILIVDPDRANTAAAITALAQDFDVRIADTPAQAEIVLAEEAVEVVLASQYLRGASGAAFLARVREHWPDVVRLLLVPASAGDDILRSAQDIALFQCVTTPWQPLMLLAHIRQAAERYRLQRDCATLAVEVQLTAARTPQPTAVRKPGPALVRASEDGIVRAPDSPMGRVCEEIDRVAPYDISVLVTGETGTGKELVARSIHAKSLRWNKPFVVENCASIPDGLLESELFGHKRGAFTGAIEDHAGLFERADGGTVFLDEIGEITPAFQAKLLRVLQDGEIRPLGTRKPKQLDVRVIAATNRDLEAEVRAGRFREDLYYRLATITITVPSLRARPMDIAVLARALLLTVQAELGKPVGAFMPETLSALSRYTWPGNVRELQNEIHHMVVMAAEHGPLGPDLLSRRIRAVADRGQNPPMPSPSLCRAAEPADPLTMGLNGTLRERIEQLEARVLAETLKRHRGNKSRAAKELGLSRVGLRAKLERYGLEDPAPAPVHHGVKAGL